MRSIGKGAVRTLVRVHRILPGFIVFFSFLASSPRMLAAQGTGPAPALTPERVLTLAKGDRPAEVREPYRAIIAADGKLYLTDVRKGDVLWFDANLVWKGNLAVLHPAGTLGQPVRTVVDSRGRILVADAESRQILIFEDGKYSGAWGGRGDAPGQFRSLDDIAVDVDGMIWAADASRSAVNVFTPDGLLERVVSGFESAWFVKPQLVAVDPAGGVVVYDQSRKQVVAGTRDGAYRWTFDLQQHMGGKELYDLTVDPTGVVYLASKDKSRVAVVDPDGALVGEIFGPSERYGSFERLTGISISAARSRMLVVDQKDLVVQAYDLTWPVGATRIEPAPRAFRSASAGKIPGRVLAVSPGAEVYGSGDAPDAGASDDRWLVQDGANFMVLGTTGETVGTVILTGGNPQEPVAAGTDDGFLLVGADRYIYRLRRDGSTLGALPNATAGGELKRPQALAWRAGDGAIAVYDADDDEIQILSPDGAFRQRVGRKGTGPGEISKALSLTFNSAGELLVLDLEGARLQVFDAYGVYKSSGSPATVNRASGNMALGVGADRWGRTFLLDQTTGTAAQFGPAGVECQVGAPWLTYPIRGLVVTPDGDMLVSGGREILNTVRFRCLGPPPPPRGLRMTLDTGPEGGIVLAWVVGTPGAESFEVYRTQDGGAPARVARSSESRVLIPRETWGTRPGEVFVRGVGEKGIVGPPSEPIPDRLTPAIRGLSGTGDEVLASELLLKEELAVAETEGREDVVPLRAAYLQSILAQGDYDRARSELQRLEASLGRERAREMSLAIARAAVSGAIRAGNGPVALSWLRPIGDLAPETLSPVESLALNVEASGDSEVAGELLVRHGYESRLSGVDLTLALAAVQADLDRPELAMKTLIDASREATGPGPKRQLDRGIFQMAAVIVDGLLDGSIVGRQDLTPEQQVDVVLRDVQAYAAETTGSSAEEWSLRIGALVAKTRIHGAAALEGSDFKAAAEAYERILTTTEFLLQPDEILVRGRLGALALATGDEDGARAQFERVLAISPDWVPDEEYFSPSVQQFVESMRPQPAGEVAPEGGEGESASEGAAGAASGVGSANR